MALSKEDVWADLRYALDELDSPSREIHSRLTDAANLDSQSEDEYWNRLLKIALLSSAYSKAQARAETRNAHEAIEKGLKAILIDGGMPEGQVRARSHNLYQLLTDIQQRHPTVFNELERCFESMISFLERVTTIRHDTNIIDYFRKYGKPEVFVANRYASIEGNNGEYGMIGLVYREIIRALLALIFGWTPKDIDSRIEAETRDAILTKSSLDPAWNVTEWLNQGPVIPRLEVIENLNKNKVLRAAVRKCAKKSRDSAIQYWAQALRRKCITARREVRAERRAG